MRTGFSECCGQRSIQACFRVSKQKGSKGEVLFANNRISALLRDDHENCIKYLVSEAPWAWV